MVDDPTVQALEEQLNNFNPAVRMDALQQLAEGLASGNIPTENRSGWVNLHCHSFCSYNGYGYSPSRVVWMARRLGLSAVGLVDFDILDGVDEFYHAGALLGVRTVAGMETRAYVPEFADKEINSPGEPGITYHMGSGFPSGHIPADQQAFADDLRQRARNRNELVLEKVNPFLDPVRLDQDKDVLPLTPTGNATERHICAAYEAKAEVMFPDPAKRAQFWADKLGSDVETVKGLNSAKLQGLIRSKTMKSGGVGYQQPTEDTFPQMRSINTFVAALGGIPTLTWLDGTRAGEEPDALLDLHQDAGSLAINIVPDRNWNLSDADDKALKLKKLYEIVEKADERGLPVQVGTEMNAPGLKFVDDFDAPELEPVKASFERGAYIIYGHVVEQMKSGNGYCSAWAAKEFASVADKNAYFEQLGRASQHLELVAQ